MVTTYFAELIDARDLFYTWAQREFKVRYSQSVLGAAWAVLQPLALTIVTSIVFSVIARVPTGEIPAPIFFYSGMLPWTFFQNSLTFAIPSLVTNMNLVSKIYFPREILPLASIMVAFLDFTIACSIFVLMMIFYRIPISWSIALVPVILIIQILLTFGVSLLAAAVNVFYRDIRFVIPLLLQIWMYLSPVLYPAALVPDSPEWVRVVYFLNPMAAIIDSFRRVMLTQEMPQWPYLGFAAVFSLLLTIFAYHYFKTTEKQFADLI